MEIPGGVAVHPVLLAGPAFAFNLSCNIEGRAQGASLQIGCDEIDADVATADIGALVGGALEFPVGSHALSLGVRYTFGLADISEGSSVKNRALGLMAGVRF